MRSGDLYTDREFCAAERRGGIYGLTVGGSVYALTAGGRALLLPQAAAEAWRSLPLQEPSLITPSDPWSDADQLAAERAGIG